LANKDDQLAKILGLNAANISLFLISPYLAAIFSAFAQILQKTTFVELLEPALPQKVAIQVFLVFNRTISNICSN
jgi:hypothetical protein